MRRRAASRTYMASSVLTDGTNGNNHVLRSPAADGPSKCRLVGILVSGDANMLVTVAKATAAWGTTGSTTERALNTATGNDVDAYDDGDTAAEGGSAVHMSFYVLAFDYVDLADFFYNLDIGAGDSIEIHCAPGNGKKSYVTYVWEEL